MQSLRTLLVGLLVTAVAVGASSRQTERLLKDSDLNKLGESFQDYIEARNKNKGVSKAENDVQAAMDKLERKLAKTPAAGDVLASPADLGYAMYLSFDHRRLRGGKISKEEYVGPSFDKDNPLEYAVWAPSKYALKTGPYPLIIAIPDEDETITEHLIEDWIDADVRDNVILAVPRMPEDRSQWTEIAGVGRVLVLMRAIYEDYAVDFDRIYLAGRGLGVATAVAIAGKFPDRFAGVIGRTGDCGDTPPDNFQNLPTYFAGGGAKVSAFEKAVGELGYDNCSVEPEGKEKDIWNWIQNTTRQPYPDQVSLVPGRPFPRRAYWLEVPPSDGSTPGQIEATIDRSTNTVTVDGKGMTEFVLHFNDVMLDMDKPIKVIANGQEYQDQVPRSRRVVLSLIINGVCDPGRMFVNSKQYHLPMIAGDGDGEGE